MNRKDREALKRALRVTQAEPGRGEQIKAMRADGESWESVAEFCAYHQQMRRLSLRPWEYPPCWMTDQRPLADPNKYGLLAAWQLRQRLLAGGLSAFEPDPLTALSRLETPAA
jgi:hypothetical protein